MRRLRLHILSLITLFLWAGSVVQLKAQTPSTANQVKAVFLYNFTQFVEWPTNSFTSNTSPFIIGILGNDPFGTYLESVVEGEKFGSHPIMIKRYNDVKDVNACHILFLNTTNASSAIKDFRNRSILTVSDQNDFATSGGIIRFFIANSKIRLQINLQAAKAANLTISSKLLRLADVIN